MQQMVVGGNGFVGRYLTEELTRSGDNVISVVLNARAGSPGKTVVCDVSDPVGAEGLLQNHFPDRIYFLAGNAKVSQAQNNETYFRQNTLSLLRFLEAVGKRKRPIQLFFASTMHVYGNPGGDVVETTPIFPQSYYGFSKYLAERALEEFSKEHPLAEIIVGRLYTCIGPGQPEGFVVPDLCKKIRKLAPGEKLSVRSPQSFRQFMDARDLAALLPKLWDVKGRKGLEYLNLASPEVSTIEEIARALLVESGSSAGIEPQPETNNPFLGIRVPPEKLKRWVPHFSFRPLKETLRDVWRAVPN